MDRILKVVKKDKIVHPLIDFVTQHRYVYVMGKTGIGKTFALKKCFPDALYVSPEILRSKQATIEFFERISGSSYPVIIDDYDAVDDNIGLREITGPVNRGPLIIVGIKNHSLDGKPAVYVFPHMDICDIMKLVQSPKTERAAVMCQGDIRRFFQSVLYDSDDPDIFQTSKQVLESFVCTKGSADPMNFIGKYFEEHGNMLGLMQENYLKSPSVDCVYTTECFSNADMIDKVLYNGDWHFMSFFFTEGVIRPAVHIGHSIESLDSASLWSKELNIRMREKKIRVMSKRAPTSRLGYNELVLLGKYINSDVEKAIELAVEYKLESADIDVINHLHKLKTKNALLVKKQCQDHASTPKTPTKSLKS